VWATHPKRPHQEIYESLKKQKILVRFMRFPEVAWAPEKIVTGLRISIGTDPEIDVLLSTLGRIM
jgi:histidinol-phosphate aminotransferase